MDKVYDLGPELVTRTVHFWGYDYEVTPALVGEVFGDGRQLIYFTPLATRPNWYVVRVDSSWNESNWSNGDCIGNHTDDIYDAIEEQYGRCYDDEADEEGDPFPALDSDYGVGWGRIAMLEPGGRYLLPEAQPQHEAVQAIGGSPA